MSDRTINFGESETEATYQIQDTDSTGGGNFVVAKDTNANTVLLQYDPDTDTWGYAGDVDMNGGNVSGVGTLTAESVNTERLEDGIVGDGNQITSIWGNDGEEVILASGGCGPLDEDFTNTSESNFGLDQAQGIRLPSTDTYTNISDIKGQWAIRELSVPDGEEVTLRTRVFDDTGSPFSSPTETFTESDQFIKSSKFDIDEAETVIFPAARAATTGGTANITGFFTLIITGVIGT